MLVYSMHIMHMHMPHTSSYESVTVASVVSTLGMLRTLLTYSCTTTLASISSTLGLY